MPEKVGLKRLAAFLKELGFQSLSECCLRLRMAKTVRKSSSSRGTGINYVKMILELERGILRVNR